MKRVLQTTNAAEAHIAVAALENAGIDAVIQGEHMGALPLGPASRPSVWVDEQDYDSACEILGVAPAVEPPSENGTPIRPLLWIVLAMIVGIVLLRVLQARV